MKAIVNKLVLSFVLILALTATLITACEPTDADTVTLSLYLHEGSTSGSFLEGVEVSGQDGAGSSFSQVTDSSGCVTITGAPGSWSFSASRYGYDDKSWDQSISDTCEKHAYLNATALGAPTIPPITTFMMDFDDFSAEAEIASVAIDTEQSVQLASLITGDDDTYPSDEYVIGDRQNWNFAAFNVGAWNLITSAGLAVPVATFVNSFKYTPEQQPDYTWVWSYDVQVGQDTYTAELNGKYKQGENGVIWDMYISKQGEYEDFHWYTGESNLPATEGFWILMNKPSDPTKLLQIDWERDLADDTYSIKYTNIVDGGPENGGYIANGATIPTDESPYDRYYEIYNKGADNLTNIEWNSTTKEGRVKAPHYFGDDAWHYWDANHENAEGGE